MSVSSHGQKSPQCISGTRWRPLFSCLHAWEELIREQSCSRRHKWSFILHVGGNYLSLLSGKNLCLGTKGKGGGGDISYVRGLRCVREVYCNLKDAKKKVLDPATSDSFPVSWVIRDVRSSSWTLKVGLLHGLQGFLLIKCCRFLAIILLLSLVSPGFKSFF